MCRTAVRSCACVHQPRGLHAVCMANGVSSVDHRRDLPKTRSSKPTGIVARVVVEAPVGTVEEHVFAAPRQRSALHAEVEVEGGPVSCSPTPAVSTIPLLAGGDGAGAIGKTSSCAGRELKSWIRRGRRRRRSSSETDTGPGSARSCGSTGRGPALAMTGGSTPSSRRSVTFCQRQRAERQRDDDDGR